MNTEGTCAKCMRGAVWRVTVGGVVMRVCPAHFATMVGEADIGEAHPLWTERSRNVKNTGRTDGKS